MRTFIATAALLAGSLISTRAAPLNNYTLTARGGSGPLYYYSTGHPACGDIREAVGAVDCWYLSAMCALAKINPKWLSDKINPDGGDPRSLGQATFTVYDVYGKHQNEVVTYDEAVGPLTSNDQATAAWWVGGFEIAALKMGFVWQIVGQPAGAINGHFTGADAAMGLSILTGLRATTEQDLSYDQVWNIITEHSDHTPVILSTKPTGATVLGSMHGYTVMSSYMDGNKKMVILFAEAHDTAPYHLDDIFQDILAVSHFTNGDTYHNE